MAGERKGRQFFLWIHLYDAHLPYSRHSSVKEKFILDENQEKDFIKYLEVEQGINSKIFKNNFKKNMLSAVNQYDKEIIFLDKQINTLFDYAEKNNISDNTLWIITSEHGEGLGSHDFYEHVGMLYEEQILTPIIFYIPSYHHPKIIDSIVEHIDILPSVLDVLGTDINHKNQISQFEGKSFLPFILNDLDSNKYSFSWSGKIESRTTKKKINKFKNDFLEKQIFAKEKFSLQNNQYKYIYNLNKEDEFYNLKNDPNENNNLIDSPIKEKNEMKKVLFSKINRFQKESIDIGPQDIDESFSPELESLGYFR